MARVDRKRGSRRIFNHRYTLLSAIKLLLTRTRYLHNGLCSTHEHANRVGAGAFEYEFGALEDSDNQLVQTYDVCLRSQPLHSEGAAVNDAF